jgi:hypothetical protein
MCKTLGRMIVRLRWDRRGKGYRMATSLDGFLWRITYVGSP